jgi:uncharacterized protein YndB with AHSA1/START domain
MIDQHDTANAVITECELPDAPEKVWRALTVPELLAAWLMPNDMPTREGRPEVGDRFRFEPHPGHGRKSAAGRVADGPIECEVLAAEANRLLRYRWRSGEGERDPAGHSLDSIVTFELTETTTGGTYLRVVHSDFPLSLRGAASVAPEMTSNPEMTSDGTAATERTRSQALANVTAFPSRAARRVPPQGRGAPVTMSSTLRRTRWAA